jgi:hypothetical protein
MQQVHHLSNGGVQDTDRAHAERQRQNCDRRNRDNARVAAELQRRDEDLYRDD